MSRLLPLLALAACAPAEEPAFGSGGTSGSTDIEDSENCPAGMVEVIPEGAVTLGEPDEAALEEYPGTVIPETDLDLDPYCIGALPLPGARYDAWMRDGLNIGQAEILDGLLTEHGRRLCTVSELLYAAAGPENLRYPYGPDYERASCDSEAFTPNPQGTFADCESPVGARDFLVRSSWALLDDPIRDALEPLREEGFPGDGTYAIYGGSAQRDTFYSPDNFGIHLYGPDDYSEDNPAYVTDDLRVCGDVGALDEATEASWEAFLAQLREEGRYRPVIGSGL